MARDGGESDRVEIRKLMACDPTESTYSQLRQTQAEADGRRGAAGQDLGKDHSKITAFESLESSLGADAVGCLVL